MLEIPYLIFLEGVLNLSDYIYLGVVQSRCWGPEYIGGKMQNTPYSIRGDSKVYP